MRRDQVGLPREVDHEIMNIHDVELILRTTIVHNIHARTSASTFQLRSRVPVADVEGLRDS